MAHRQSHSDPLLVSVSAKLEAVEDKLDRLTRLVVRMSRRLVEQDRLLGQVTDWTRQLDESNDKLEAALGAADGSEPPQHYSDRRPLEKEAAMAQPQIDALKAELERNTSAVGSITALVTSLLAQVEDAKDDPQQIQEVVDKFRANNDALIAAALSGTPQEPGPQEPPPAPATTRR
jgi:chromosome segregation ATPase